MESSCFAISFNLVKKNFTKYFSHMFSKTINSSHNQTKKSINKRKANMKETAC